MLAGKVDARFAWPPQGDDDVRGFERSMAAGAPPIVEALRGLAPSIFGPGASRWLDIGGDDGTVAIGVDACVSRLREVEWYTTALADLGFVDIRVVPGPFDTIVATRG